MHGRRPPPGARDGERKTRPYSYKSGEKSPSRAIDYFRQRTAIADFYQVHLGERDYLSGATRVLPFRTFCAELALP